MCSSMAATLFFCPNKAVRVQAFFADDPSENAEETYETVMCTACRQLHLVNPKSGKVLGSEDA
jgi:hypothetical protein